MSVQPSGVKVVGPDEGVRQVVLGDRQRVILAGADTGGTIAVVEDTNPPGFGIPLHLHRREDETFHVVAGTVEFRIAGEVVRAGPGTTVHIPRDVPHAFTVAGDAPATMRITLTPAGLERYFAELAQFPPGPPDMARLAEVSARYGIEFRAEPDGPAA